MTQNKKFLDLLFIISTYIIFILVLAYVYNFDLSYFIQFSQYTDINELPLKISTTNNVGYDGQYYFRLAFNPLNFEEKYIGIAIGNATYRYSRLGYPILLWLFSFNQINLIIPISIILNFISILLIYFINLRIFKHLNIDKTYLIAICLLPGFIFCIARSLPEIIEILFISLYLLLYLKNKKFLFIIIASFAILIRETSIMFVLVIFIYDYLKNKGSFSSLYFSFPLFIYGIWILIIYSLFQESPFHTGFKLHFEPPFFGIFKMAGLFFSNNPISKQIVFLFEYIFLYSTIILAFMSLKASNLNPLIKYSFILYAVYFLCLNPVVLSSDWAFMRIFLELNYLSSLLIFSVHNLYARIYKFFMIFILQFAILRIIVDQFIEYFPEKTLF